MAQGQVRFRRKQKTSLAAIRSNDMPAKRDNFLADAVAPARQKGTSYLDGFRFGFGFFIAGLLVALIVAGISWGIIVAFNLH
jgi:hypothetical protein